MKKITKLTLTIALCISSLFAFSFLTGKVKAEDKETYVVQYDQEKSIYEKVENNTTVNKFTLYFIIPEEAKDYQNVKLDLSTAMMDGLSYYLRSPGDWFNFDIIIENNSGVNYTYQSDSLFVTDLNMTGGEAANKWGLRAFDGELLDTKYVPYRIGNAKAIYSGLFGLDRSSKVTGQMMFTIDEKITEKGYKGENLLTQYLLDYYNNAENGYNVDGIIAKQIKDLDAIALDNIFSDGIRVHSNGTYTLSDAEYNALSEEQKQKIEKIGTRKYRFRETETELAEYYYNYFYDWCLGLQFGDYVTSKSANDLNNLDNRTVSKSSIVKLYNNVNNIRTKSDNYIASALTDESLKDGSKASFIAGFTVDGPLTGNNAQSYSIGFNSSITLEKEVKGTLSVTKTINYDPYETSDDPFFIFKATNVETKAAYYRVMALNDLKQTGTVVFENLPLGNYTVQEFNPIRYSMEEEKEVSLTNSSPDTSVTFNNKKTKDNDFSDSDMVVNSFSKNEDGTLSITQRKVEVE